MPIQVTYPGVYIEELPSGQHTISGVATSITAFVGRAPIGPVDEPLTIFSFGDFERFYGGLSYDYPMGYAVRDFFLNGGSQAVIARVFNPAGTGEAILTFPNPPVPDAMGWQVEYVAGQSPKSGGYSLNLINNEPTDDVHEAEVGDTFTIPGDPQVYTVTDFKENESDTPLTAQVDFMPALKKEPCPCVILNFKRGPEPNSWSMSAAPPPPIAWKVTSDSVAGTSLAIEDGAVNPRAGDTFKVEGNSKTYTVKEDFTSDSLSILETLTAGEIKENTPLTFTRPLNPTPIDWKVTSDSAAGTSLAIEDGAVNPRAGDTFKVEGNSKTYTVKEDFTSDSLSILETLTAGEIKENTPLTFTRPLNPTPIDWKVTSDSAAGTSLAIEDGAVNPRAGDTFKVEGNSKTYTVKEDFTSDSLSILETLTAGEIKEETPLTFTRPFSGPNTIVIQRGEGAPKVGNTFTFSVKKGSSGSYVITSYTPVSEWNPLAKIEFTPQLCQPAKDNLPLTFSEPIPPAMPVGWQVLSTKEIDDGMKIELTGGAGEPTYGDVFTVGDGTKKYTVSNYNVSSNYNASTKKETIIRTVTTNTKASKSDFPPCKKLKFKRIFPSQTWSISQGNGKEQKITVKSSSTDGTQGTIVPGMLFYVGEDESQPYEVRYFEKAGGGDGNGGDSYHLYFLPQPDDKDGFSSGASLEFIPQLTLEAANPGKWGNGLNAQVQLLKPKLGEKPDQYGLLSEDRFNLTVIYTDVRGKTTSENYLNVSLKDTHDPNRLDRVLKEKSQLVRLKNDLTMLPDPLVPADKAIATGKTGTDSKPLDAVTYIGNEFTKTGLYLLDKASLINILCIPPDQREGDQFAAVYTKAVKYCADRRAMLIVDPPNSWAEKAKAGLIPEISPVDPGLGIEGEDAQNAAVYFPRVIEQDLEMKGQTYVFPACGIIAGLWAATDVSRGVWKAPAGQDVGLLGIVGLEVNLNDQQNGQLNPLGINCLRNFPIIGNVIWGARTLRGADQLESDYKYINVRRLTDYIEDSLYQGTKWAVFEPNDEALWSALRLSVGGFMAELSRQGAFYDYKVACDATTTTQRDIDLGNVNVLVQFAPVKPAEFVVLQIQQQAGKSS